MVRRLRKQSKLLYKSNELEDHAGHDDCATGWHKKCPLKIATRNITRHASMLCDVLRKKSIVTDVKHACQPDRGFLPVTFTTETVFGLPA